MSRFGLWAATAPARASVVIGMQQADSCHRRA
jgi:hypothetical protein